MKKTEFEPRDLFLSFRDSMLYILLRWKSILLVALAGALLVGGLTYVRDTRRYQAAGETATHEPAMPELTTEGAARVALVQRYQKAYDSVCVYNENAPLMKIDFTAAPTRRITYLVTGQNSVAAAALCRQVLMAEDLFVQMTARFTEEQRAVWPAYLSELVTVETEHDPSDAAAWSLVTAEIVAPDEELRDQLADLLRSEMERVITSANGVKGKWMADVGSVRYSERVYLRQMDSLKQQKQLLTDRNAATAVLTAVDKAYMDGTQHVDDPDWQYPAPSVSVKAVALGFAAGFALMVLWYALRYLFCGRVLSEEDVAVRHGIPVLGSVAGTPAKCPLNRLWRRWLQDKPADPALLACRLALMAEEAGMTCVYAMGDLPSVFVHELEQNNISVVAGGNPAEDAESMNGLTTTDGLVAVVHGECARHADLARGLAVARDLDCPVLGAIILQ